MRRVCKGLLSRFHFVRSVRTYGNGRVLSILSQLPDARRLSSLALPPPPSSTPDRPEYREHEDMVIKGWKKDETAAAQEVHLKAFFASMEQAAGGALSGLESLDLRGARARKYKGEEGRERGRGSRYSYKHTSH